MELTKRNEHMPDQKSLGCVDALLWRTTEAHFHRCIGAKGKTLKHSADLFPVLAPWASVMLE